LEQGPVDAASISAFGEVEVYKDPRAFSWTSPLCSRPRGGIPAGGKTAQGE